MKETLSILHPERGGDKALMAWALVEELFLQLPLSGTQQQRNTILQGLNGISSSVQEDFSELPPNQRRKKLQNKIDEYTAKISQVAHAFIHR